MQINRKKMILIFFTFVISAFFLTSCTDFIKSPMELVQKPRLEKEQELIADVINAHIPPNAYLARPIVSNDLSSANFVDINNDGVDEVYAFYVDKVKMNVGLVILHRVEKNWELLSRIGNVGKDIAYSTFEDVDGDGKLDIIIGTTGDDINFKSLFIYRLNSENELHLIYKDLYNEILIDDLDDDKKKEVLLLRLDRENYADAKLIKYYDDDMNIVDKISMDPYISGYYNLIYGNINEDEKAVVLDFKIGTKSATNMLFFRNNKLQLAFDSFENSEMYRKTLKERPIKSFDYNNDGFIEIGSSFVSHVHSENSEVIADIVNWLKYKKNKFIDYKLVYYSKKSNLEMKFPRYITGLVYSSKLVIVDSKSYLGGNIMSMYYTENEQVFKVLEINRYDEETYDEFIKKKLNSSMSRKEAEVEVQKQYGTKLADVGNYVYVIKYSDIPKYRDEFEYSKNFVSKLEEIKNNRKSIENGIIIK